MKFRTATKQERKKHLRFLKWFFLIPLISLIIWFGFWFIPSENFSWILFWIGFIGIELFLIWFSVENLIVMWKTQHYIYFAFAIPFGILRLIFYFSYYYPYLKGEKSFDEIKKES